MRTLLIAFACLCATSLAGADGDAKRFEYRQVHMGLPVRILLHADARDTADRAAAAAFERIAELERIMSDYRPDSDVRQLEARAGRWTVVAPELFEVLRGAREVAEHTGGAFDPTVGAVVRLWRDSRRTRALPSTSALEEARRRTGWRWLELDEKRRAVRLARAGMRIDLGGIAKGYILQRAIDRLRARGAARSFIEAGGDVCAGDAPPGEPGWKVDVERAQPEFQARAAALSNACLATSGASEQFVDIRGVRYSHIVNPRTGIGLTTSTEASVIDADGAVADALATALTVLGPADARDVMSRFPAALFDIRTSQASKQR